MMILIYFITEIQAGIKTTRNKIVKNESSLKEFTFTDKIDVNMFTDNEVEE